MCMRDCVYVRVLVCVSVYVSICLPIFSPISHNNIDTITHRYLTEAEPWKMKGTDESRRPAIVRTTLEALYAFMHLLAPVLPMAAQEGTGLE